MKTSTLDNVYIVVYLLNGRQYKLEIKAPTSTIALEIVKRLDLPKGGVILSVFKK